MGGAEDEDLAELRAKVEAGWVELAGNVRTLVAGWAGVGGTPGEIRSKVMELGRALAADFSDPRGHETLMAVLQRAMEDALAEVFADPGTPDEPPDDEGDPASVLSGSAGSVAAPDGGGLLGPGLGAAYLQALPFVAGLARAYMHAPAEKRAEYLEGVRVTARALLRFAMEVAPVLSPGTGRESVRGWVSREFLGRLEQAVSLAGLDAFQAETLVGVVQRGFAEATETPPTV